MTRGGFPRETDASKTLGTVRELIKLAGDDEKSRRKIGDLIFEKSARGGELPAVEDVRRRLGLRRDNLGASQAFGESWRAWLAGKKKLRPSSAKRLGELGDHWLIPVLEDIPVDPITGEHCAMVFERVEMLNEEIERHARTSASPCYPATCARSRRLSA